MDALEMININLKATSLQEEIIRYAAEINNKSLTEFILESAFSAAENALLNQRLFLLDDVKWQKFQDILDKPASVKPGLDKLMKSKSPWE